MDDCETDNIKFKAWNCRRFLRQDEFAILPNGGILIKDNDEWYEDNLLDIKLYQSTGMFDKKPASYVNPVTLDSVLKSEFKE